MLNKQTKNKKNIQHNAKINHVLRIVMQFDVYEILLLRRSTAAAAFVSLLDACVAINIFFSVLFRVVSVLFFSLLFIQTRMMVRLLKTYHLRLNTFN